jgi:hypothetical protein
MIAIGGQLQALARFRHHLITGNRFNFAAKVLGVATLRLLEPKFLDVRIFAWVKASMSTRIELNPLPCGKGANAFRSGHRIDYSRFNYRPPIQ